MTIKDVIKTLKVFSKGRYYRIKVKSIHLEFDEEYYNCMKEDWEVTPKSLYIGESSEIKNKG